MNWETIKHIYYCVLVRNHKVEYLGEDEYIITAYHRNGQKHWKTGYRNGMFYGKSKTWLTDGTKYSEFEYENGKLVE